MYFFWLGEQVKENGECAITDIHSSNPLGHNADHTQILEASPSHDYIYEAPETRMQHTGLTAINPVKADIYSLGVIMWTMMHRSIPFDGKFRV